MSKRTLSLVALAVSILAVIAAGFFVIRMDRSGSSAIVSPVKTYSSQMYGLIFLYPKTYFIVEHDATSTGAHSIVLFEDTPTTRKIANGASGATEAPPAVTVDIYPNTKGLTTASWVQHARESNFNLSDKKLVSVKLAGEQALMYTWSGLYESQTIARARAKFIYAISVGYLGKDDPIMTAFSVVASSTTFVK